MQPVKANKGSSPTIPRANSGMYGTADDPSASADINTADAAGTSVHAGPVPLYLIPQTLSAEIHAHGGEISGISFRRTGQHVYAITLTKTPKRGNGAGAGTGTGTGTETGTSRTAAKPGRGDADAA